MRKQLLRAAAQQPAPETQPLSFNSLAVLGRMAAQPDDDGAKSGGAPATPQPPSLFPVQGILNRMLGRPDAPPAPSQSPGPIWTPAPPTYPPIRIINQTGGTRSPQQPVQRQRISQPPAAAAAIAAAAQPQSAPVAPATPESGRFFNDVWREGFVNPGRQTASGLWRAAAGANHLTANAADLLDGAATKVSQFTGTAKGGAFADLRDWARQAEQQSQARAERLANGRNDFASQLYRGLSQGVAEIPEYGDAVALGGPVAGMGTLAGLQAEDRGPKEALNAGVNGALTGGAYEMLGPASPLVRSAGAGTLTYLDAWLNGASPQDALAAAISGGALAAPGSGRYPEKKPGSLGDATGTPPPIMTGSIAVYHSPNAAGEVQYVGISKDWIRRAVQHARRFTIQPIPRLSTLSPTDARAVEQVLIEHHGLGKNGGTLLNKINSISPSNPAYPAAVQRGKQILKIIRYPGF